MNERNNDTERQRDRVCVRRRQQDRLVGRVDAALEGDGLHVVPVVEGDGLCDGARTCTCMALEARADQDLLRRVVAQIEVVEVLADAVAGEPRVEQLALRLTSLCQDPALPGHHESHDRGRLASPFATDAHQGAAPSNNPCCRTVKVEQSAPCKT